MRGVISSSGSIGALGPVLLTIVSVTHSKFCSMTDIGIVVAIVEPTILLAEPFFVGVKEGPCAIRRFGDLKPDECSVGFGSYTGCSDLGLQL